VTNSKQSRGEDRKGGKGKKGERNEPNSLAQGIGRRGYHKRREAQGNIKQKRETKWSEQGSIKGMKTPQTKMKTEE